MTTLPFHATCLSPIRPFHIAPIPGARYHSQRTGRRTSLRPAPAGVSSTPCVSGGIVSTSPREMQQTLSITINTSVERVMASGLRPMGHRVHGHAPPPHGLAPPLGREGGPGGRETRKRQTYESLKSVRACFSSPPPASACVAGKDLTAAAKKQKAGSGAYFPINACQVSRWGAWDACLLVVGGSRCLAGCLTK